jgi:hypothetical protein
MDNYQLVTLATSSWVLFKVFQQGAGAELKTFCVQAAMYEVTNYRR